MLEITRGTTCPISITFNVLASTVTLLYLTINQSDATVIEKQLTDGTVNGNDVLFTLSQTETLLLNAGVAALLQARYKIGDNAWATRIVDVSIADVLKDGAI